MHDTDTNKGIGKGAKDAMFSARGHPCALNIAHIVINGVTGEEKPAEVRNVLAPSVPWGAQPPDHRD